MCYSQSMKKGFTLVELLIVVAILGILVAVGVVSGNRYIESAKANVTKTNYKNFINEVSSLLMKCHMGDDKIYLKINEEYAPYNYECNSAIGNFLTLYRTHLDEYKRLRNPYRPDQPAFSYGPPQDTLKGRLGYVNMWIEGSSPYAPIKVFTEYEEGKVLQSTILTCLAGGCDFSE